MMRKMRTLIPGTDSKSQAVRTKTNPENIGDTIVMTRKRRMKVKSTWYQDLLSRMMRTSS
jgi:hypothetical protein